MLGQGFIEQFVIHPQDDDEDWLNANFSDPDGDPDNTENTDNENFPELDEDDEGYLKATRLNQVGYFDVDGAPYGHVYSRETVERELSQGQGNHFDDHLQSPFRIEEESGIDADDEDDPNQSSIFAVMSSYHIYTMRKRVDEANEKWGSGDYDPTEQYCRCTKVRFNQQIEFYSIETENLAEEEEDNEIPGKVVVVKTVAELRPDDIQSQVPAPVVRFSYTKEDCLFEKAGTDGADVGDMGLDGRIETMSIPLPDDPFEQLPNPILPSDPKEQEVDACKHPPSSVLVMVDQENDATVNEVNEPPSPPLPSIDCAQTESKQKSHSVPEPPEKIASLANKNLEDKPKNPKVVPPEATRPLKRIKMKKGETKSVPKANSKFVQHKTPFTSSSSSAPASARGIKPPKTNINIRLGQSSSFEKVSKKPTERPTPLSKSSCLIHFPHKFQELLDPPLNTMNPILQSVLEHKNLSILTKPCGQCPPGPMFRELRSQILKHNVQKSSLQNSLSKKILRYIFDSSSLPQEGTHFRKETVSSKSKCKPCNIHSVDPSGSSKWASKPGSNKEREKSQKNSQQINRVKNLERFEKEKEKEANKEGRRKSKLEKGAQSLSLRKECVPVIVPFNPALTRSPPSVDVVKRNRPSLMCKKRSNTTRNMAVPKT